MEQVDIAIHETIISNFNLIIVVIGAILLPILLHLFVKVMNNGYREFTEFKNSQPDIVKYFLDQASEIAYRFVEQKTKELDGLENSKKIELAVAKANEWLKNMGFDLPKDIIVMAIESYIHFIHEEGISKLDIVKDMQEKQIEEEKPQ